MTNGADQPQSTASGRGSSGLERALKCPRYSAFVFANGPKLTNPQDLEAWRKVYASRPWNGTPAMQRGSQIHLWLERYREGAAPVDVGEQAFCEAYDRWAFHKDKHVLVEEEVSAPIGLLVEHFGNARLRELAQPVWDEPVSTRADLQILGVSPGDPNPIVVDYKTGGKPKEAYQYTFSIQLGILTMVTAIDADTSADPRSPVIEAINQEAPWTFKRFTVYQSREVLHEILSLIIEAARTELLARSRPPADLAPRGRLTGLCYQCPFREACERLPYARGDL